MYQVIIIEDDPMVSTINRQYTELNKHLKVSGVFSNGQLALDYLKTNQVDLIILDLYMPVMDGRSFIKELRRLKIKAEVIMVTAANDSANIKELLSYGILDYLVKPFEYVRFNHALGLFLQKMELLNQTHLTQNELDSLLSSSTQPLTKDDLISKGLQEKTLKLLLDFLKLHKGTLLTCEEIAEATKLSKVTVRRYMNYLLENNSITSTVNYTTGGRPSILYRYLG